MQMHKIAVTEDMVRQEVEIVRITQHFPFRSSCAWQICSVLLAVTADSLQQLCHCTVKLDLKVDYDSWNLNLNLNLVQYCTNCWQNVENGNCFLALAQLLIVLRLDSSYYCEEAHMQVLWLVDQCFWLDDTPV